MSLIQEALKRQQMEQEGKVPPPGGTAEDSSPLKSTVVDGETFILPGMMPESPAPSAPEVAAKPSLKRNVKSAPEPVTEPDEPSPTTPAPAPTPDRKRISPTPAGDDESDGKKTRVLPSLAAVIILLLLLAGALVWAVTYGLEMAGIRMPWVKGEPVVAEQSAEDLPAAEAAGVGAAAEVKVAETPITAKPADVKADADAGKPARKPTIGSVVRQTATDANAAAGEANVVIADAAGEPATAVEPSVKPTPATELPSGVTDAAAEAPPSAVATTPAVPAPPPAPVKWPDITISGVVGKEIKGAVFINGKVFGVNETVEGIRILAIKPQGALLEYQGETRLAKVGQPLNRGTR